MPDIKVDDGCTIHAELEGPQSAPVLMLSNSLGTDLHMWDEQVGPLTPGARIAVLEAAHISNLEQPQAYTDTMLEFLLG